MATLISAQRNGRRDSDFKISSFGQFDINSVNEGNHPVHC